MAGGMNATQSYLWRQQRGLGLDVCEAAPLVALCAAVESVMGLQVRRDKSSFRRQEATMPRPLPWHQDWEPMGGHVTGSLGGMVTWVPADPIDGTRPALELAEADRALPHEHGEWGFLQLAQPVTGPTTVLTGLEIGDVVLFSPFAPHRTVLCGTQPRRSFDLRGYPRKEILWAS